MTTLCDYLIIGGGSSGAVVARRLAEKTTGRIILLEAGKTDEGDPAAIDLKRLDEQTPDYDWGFRAAHAAGRRRPSSTMRAPGCWAAAPTTMTAPSSARPIPISTNGSASAPPAGTARRWRHTGSASPTPSPSRPHPATRPAAASSRPGSRWACEEVDFGEEVRQGVGLFPLNARGRAPAVVLRRLSPPDRRTAEASRGVDAVHGDAAHHRGRPRRGC